MDKILIIATGSIAGGLSRYYLSGWMTRWLGANFPYGTLAVNLAGCFLIGIVAAISEGRMGLSPQNQLLWIAGFCGAFTTFSTFIFDNARLADQGSPAMAFINIAASLGLGFLAFRAGQFLGKLM